MMSNNYRKDIDVYSQQCMPEQDGAGWKVYRPNSMRRVSAVKELNRLKTQLSEECKITEAVKQSHFDRIKQVNAQIKKLEARLEINPIDPSADGIYCRDETIRLLQAQLDSVRRKIRHTAHADGCRWDTAPTRKCTCWKSSLRKAFNGEDDG